MVKLCGVIGTLVLATALVVGCRPTVAPAVAPTAVPAQNPAPPSAPASNLSPQAQDGPWAGVVSAAKKEGKLTAYSYNMVGDVGKRVSTAFAEKYGIKVDIITGMGAALSERILTETRMGNLVADLMDANSFQISHVKDSGATVSSSDLPALQEKGVWRAEPGISDPQQHVLVHTLPLNSPYVNTNLVKPGEEPRSFKELAQPRWRGKMVMIDPAITGNASNVFATLLRRNVMDVDTIRAIGKNDIKFTPNAAEAARLLVSGTYQMDVLTGQGTYSSLLGEISSLPVRAVALEEGTLVSNRAIGALKNGPHPNATRLFINWLFTKEGQTVFSGAQALTPVRGDVPDSTPAHVQIKPVRLIVLTLEDEKKNTELFREGWLAKLWKN